MLITSREAIFEFLPEKLRTFQNIYMMLWFISVDGKMYHVRVESHTVFRYYLHDDWRSVVFEQVSTYDVNGVKGYGIFEFLYRSVI